MMELMPCPKCGKMPEIFCQPSRGNFPDFYELVHNCETGSSLGIGGFGLGSIILGWNARCEADNA